MQQHFLTWDSELATARNYFSLHYYSDLGYPNLCEKEGNGSHVEF